ncbi:MAG: tetratricopeptide repeat protein [Gemmatimonadaceae bacterium]
MRASIVAALVIALALPRFLAAQEDVTARADNLFGAGHYKESIAAYERALQLRAPRPADNAWHIARAYVRLGNAKQASRWLEHARQLGFANEQAVASEPGMREMVASVARRDRGPLRVPTVCASICARSTHPLPTRS